MQHSMGKWKIYFELFNFLMLDNLHKVRANEHFGRNNCKGDYGLSYKNDANKKFNRKTQNL